MRKFLIAALGLASLAALTGTASATKVEMSQSELKDYCGKKGGMFNADSKGGSNCTIGLGKNQVFIACGPAGDCTISHTMVFSSKPSTHGPVGQASDTTLGNGSKKPAAGNTTGAGSTPVGSGNAGNGAPTGIKPPANSASTTVGANGGGPNGRPALQRQ